MALDRVLCCVNSKVWIPDAFLTTIVGDCDRGKFKITRPFTYPCMLMANGNLYIEDHEGMEVPSADVELSQVRCATCGREVEVREIDIKAILSKLRDREIVMKERHRQRESQKVDKSKPASGGVPQAGPVPPKPGG